MPGIIEVNGLSKSFGEIKAVDDLSFSVSPGEIYGFLGQNGAGKSTTIRMLLSLIRPGSGNILFFDKELSKNRNEILSKVGAIIEKPDLYKFLTAYENLKIAASLSRARVSKTQLMNTLELVGIAGRANSRVKTFSQGMKQRLGMACALVHDPEIIILDEPSNGLDPQGIADMRNLILHLARNENKTILISSHLLSEIEIIADSMLIIDRGKKVAEGKVSSLFDPRNSVVHLETTNDRHVLQLIHTTAWNKLVTSSDPIRLKMHRDQVPELASYLVNNGIGIISLYHKHSLEEYFLSLTTPNQHVAAFKN